MWPLPVVVTHIDAKEPLELSAVEDEEPVEALAPDGADPSFGERVRPRCTKRGANDLDAFAAEDLVEGATELAVAVVDQEPGQYRSLGVTRQAAGLAVLSSVRRGSRCSLRSARAAC